MSEPYRDKWVSDCGTVTSPISFGTSITTSVIPVDIESHVVAHVVCACGAYLELWSGCRAVWCWRCNRRAQIVVTERTAN